MAEPRVLVIIPAYNEEDNIVATVSNVVAAGYDYIVVNDGSKDRTLSLCREQGLRVLDLPQNLGIGGAVQAGHKFAQRYGYDIDIQFDGERAGVDAFQITHALLNDEPSDARAMQMGQ